MRGRRDQDKLKETCPDSSDPYSSSPPLSSPRNNSSPTNSPPDLDDWQKPTKVAHHRSPGSGEGEPTRDKAVADNGFLALGPLGDKMDLGLTEDSGPRDMSMTDPSMVSLKRARSPPKPASSNLLTPIHSKQYFASLTSTSAFLASDQVSSSSPCLGGGRVEGGSKRSLYTLRLDPLLWV